MASSPEGIQESVVGGSFLKSEQRHKLREKQTPVYVTRAEWSVKGDFGLQTMFTLAFKADGSGDPYVLALSENDYRRKQAEALQTRIDAVKDCIGPYYLWFAKSASGHDIWKLETTPQADVTPAIRTESVTTVAAPAATPVAAPSAAPGFDTDLPF